LFFGTKEKKGVRCKSYVSEAFTAGKVCNFWIPLTRWYNGREWKVCT